jgi:cytochrome c-type biogenesis protein
MPGAEFAVALSAGVVSFLSPCVLPLVPVYLSVTTGLGIDELSRAGRGTASRVLRGAGLFILGFSTVFVALGLSATTLGQVLLRHQSVITRGAGVVVVLMAGVMLAGTSRRGFLAREWRFHPRPVRPLWAPPVAGAAFAFGWTPCVGPVLGSVLAIAATQDGAIRGALLLATYSAGLAIPLLVTGLAFQRAVGPLRWTRRHAGALTRVMATVLAGYGLLLLLDRLSWLTGALQNGLGPSG